MPRRLNSLRVALLALFAALGLAAPNELPAQLRIATRPGADDQPLRLVLRRGQAEGNFSLVLNHDGDQPLSLGG
ncbi:MAG: hypothetical protein J5I93_19045, partial [Pirellulaceae bacterium]|nr:hypothetical protein [Pirellulaceae bacterium]